MSRKDPKELTLAPIESNNPSSLRKTNTQPLLIGLDSELAESILMLGDYFPDYHRQRMTEQVFSILLLSLLVDNMDACVDAMERLYTLNCPVTEETGKMWGEFLTVASVFQDAYEQDNQLKNELEDLIRNELLDFPEEVFLVKWSKQANYLLIQ